MSPAGPCLAGPFAEGIALLSRRFSLVSGGEAPSSGHPDLPFLAGSDRRRADELNRALRDPKVRAIICARGGHGCLRILHLLDGRALRQRRPALVGFSDITALHAWAYGLGVTTIHGPVVSQLPRLPTGDLDALFALLEGGPGPTLSGLTPISGGLARGPLFCANLTVLCHLLGTPYVPRLGGAILLFEEVHEPPYRIDRMLTQLRLAGVLDRLAGVVVGDLTFDGDDPAPQRALAQRVLRDRLGDLGIPVATGAPVGHGQRNMALPQGRVATLNADDGSLKM